VKQVCSGYGCCGESGVGGRDGSSGDVLEILTDYVS
jgi:hypothetical protein